MQESTNKTFPFFMRLNRQTDLNKPKINFPRTNKQVFILSCFLASKTDYEVRYDAIENCSFESSFNLNEIHKKIKEKCVWKSPSEKRENFWFNFFGGRGWHSNQIYDIWFFYSWSGTILQISSATTNDKNSFISFLTWNHHGDLCFRPLKSRKIGINEISYFSLLGFQWKWIRIDSGSNNILEPFIQN